MIERSVVTKVHSTRRGLGLALLSAATFGTSGTFASSLIDAGWTPAAAVTVRVSLAAVILSIPALVQLRGRWRLLRSNAKVVGTYGLIAVAACQLCFFYAVQHLSVGVALLLEYLGVILVVFWMWIRHGHRPRRLTTGGAVCAIVGLGLVLDLTGSRVDFVGVIWGLCAAAGLAVFFVLSASTDESLPPLAMAWAGMAVGAVVLISAGLLGAVQLHAPRVAVRFLHHDVNWVVPVLGLSLIAAVVAYVVGIGAARLLGAKVSSFVGLTEVLFAVLFAWLLLAQVPTAMQVLGGLFIIAGVSLVRVDDLRDQSHPAKLPDIELVS